MTFWIIIACLLFTGALLLLFFSRRYAALLAFLGMLLLKIADVVPFASDQLWFCGAAAMIVQGLEVLLPGRIIRMRLGVGYMTVASIAGLLIGLLISPNVMLIGGIVGLIAGGMAFSFTPQGRTLEFPSRRFVSYLCAKGFTLIITLSIIAESLMLLYFTR